MEITPALAILIPLTIAMTAMVRQILPINDRYAPVIALVAGIVMVSLFVPGAILQVIAQGIIVGLSASGLYSQTKTVAGK